MKIQFELNIEATEEQQLCRILGCQQKDLATSIGPFAAAACYEYVKLFLGQKVFTRASDFQVYRLFLLIQNAFGNLIPEEQKICDLFQTTATQARSLVRSVISKYQYDLRQAIDDTMRKILGGATTAGTTEGGVYVTIDNESMIDALNRRITSIRGTLPPIAKRTNTVSQYLVPQSSFEELSTALGLTTAPKKK